MGRSAVHGIVQRRTHGDLAGEMGDESAVEVGGIAGEMGGELAVLAGEVVVLLLVHLLVDDIGLGNAEGAAGAALVDLRGASSRLNAGLERAVTPSRCSNVCTLDELLVVKLVNFNSDIDGPLLVLLVASLGLDGLDVGE